ncbi:DNA-binding response regulator [Taibaiella sp. KBW10]|uniref:response regulator n=1 Tax=Taibaiella sp. KBW10 TaxID=2153357 RepID=UPI000F5AFCDD|nr:response regulator transcription factor [Taibaiella sp. KBW10]RQO30101.1 DNA-binding response regulator [Taibaiella sp. KBW10]
MKIQVAIIDDHPLVRSGINAMLESDAGIEVTGLYAHFNALMVAIKANVPDVLLLDLQMADMSGAAILEVVSKQYPQLSVIILTSIDSALMVRNLMKAGAKGYVLKTTGQEEILQAIHAVYQGEIYLSKDIKDILVQSTLQHKTGMGFNTELSEREVQILQLIAAEYSSPEIAQKIHLSTRTVENYRLGLMQKLEVKNIAGLIKKAIFMGLIK